jgi:hypothetical protein
MYYGFMFLPTFLKQIKLLSVVVVFFNGVAGNIHIQHFLLCSQLFFHEFDACGNFILNMGSCTTQVSDFVDVKLQAILLDCLSRKEPKRNLYISLSEPTFDEVLRSQSVISLGISTIRF